ncbi:MAG: PD-(D/E)XK nuclease-like domain-containing protein, partial [Candidatus Omnitrophota bacterium]
MKRVIDEGKEVFHDGIYTGLDMEAYHEDPALSKSGAVDFSVSPLNYYLKRKEPEKKKDVFDLGSLAHAMILEPNKVDNNFVVIPQDVLSKSGARAGNAYKAWCEEEAAGKNRTTVMREQFDLARRIRDQVHSNPEHELASQLLTGPTEISFFYTDPIFEIRLKARPDCIPSCSVIADLKTTRSAVDWIFGAQAYKLKYHWSAAMSLMIVSALTKKTIKDYY